MPPGVENFDHFTNLRVQRQRDDIEMQRSQFGRIL